MLSECETYAARANPRVRTPTKKTALHYPENRFEYGRRVEPESRKQSRELFSGDGNGNIITADRQRLTGGIRFPVTEAELLSECETYAARANPRVRTPAKKTALHYPENRFEYGRRVGVRTPDPLIKSQLLYQLSYAPIIIRQNGI